MLQRPDVGYTNETMEETPTYHKWIKLAVAVWTVRMCIMASGMLLPLVVGLISLVPRTLRPLHVPSPVLQELAWEHPTPEVVGDIVYGKVPVLIRNAPLPKAHSLDLLMRAWLPEHLEGVKVKYGQRQLQIQPQAPDDIPGQAQCVSIFTYYDEAAAWSDLKKTETTAGADEGDAATGTAAVTMYPPPHSAVSTEAALAGGYKRMRMESISFLERAASNTAGVGVGGAMDCSSRELSYVTVPLTSSTTASGGGGSGGAPSPLLQSIAPYIAQYVAPPASAGRRRRKSNRNKPGTATTTGGAATSAGSGSGSGSGSGGDGQSTFSLPSFASPPPSKANTVPPQAALWMGEAGVVVHTHYDLEHNFLLQLSGTKRVVLTTPTAYDLFAPAASLSPHWRQASRTALHGQRGQGQGEGEGEEEAPVQDLAAVKAAVQRCLDANAHVDVFAEERWSARVELWQQGNRSTDEPVRAAADGAGTRAGGLAAAVDALCLTRSTLTTSGFYLAGNNSNHIGNYSSDGTGTGAGTGTGTGTVDAAAAADGSVEGISSWTALAQVLWAYARSNATNLHEVFAAASSISSSSSGHANSSSSNTRGAGSDVDMSRSHLFQPSAIVSWEVTLHPGDLLYIPPMYFHSVQYTSPSSHSINVWSSSLHQETKNKLRALVPPPYGKISHDDYINIRSGTDGAAATAAAHHNLEMSRFAAVGALLRTVLMDMLPDEPLHLLRRRMLMRLPPERATAGFASAAAAGGAVVGGDATRRLTVQQLAQKYFSCNAEQRMRSGQVKKVRSSAKQVQALLERLISNGGVGNSGVGSSSNGGMGEAAYILLMDYAEELLHGLVEESYLLRNEAAAADSGTAGSGTSGVSVCAADGDQHGQCSSSGGDDDNAVSVLHYSSALEAEILRIFARTCI